MKINLKRNKTIEKIFYTLLIIVLLILSYPLTNKIVEALLNFSKFCLMCEVADIQRVVNLIVSSSFLLVVIIILLTRKEE